ncbi:MAG: hypothetical protein RR058_06960 [Oscillospiraceae bacterium]
MKKIIAAILLFAVAGGITYLLRDYLDSRSPTYAIPKITVMADLQPVPTAVNGYEWSFITAGAVSEEPRSMLDIGLTPKKLLGGENLSIEFSQSLKSLKISHTSSYRYDFSPTDSLVVPFEHGGYIYEVIADFERGHAAYYFYIIVD